MDWLQKANDLTITVLWLAYLTLMLRFLLIRKKE